MTNDWIANNNALEKTFHFKSFKDAINWMIKASVAIEEVNHHPEWTNIYNKVFVRLTTHDSGNSITEKDTMLASILDNV